MEPQKQTDLKRKFSTKKYNIDVENLIKLPGRVNVYWKDEDLNYLGCNDIAAEILSLPTRNHIIGNNDFTLPLQDKSLIQNYRLADTITMKNNTTKQFYDLVITANREIFQMTIKSPLCNHDNKIIGIFGISYFISERVHNNTLNSIKDSGLPLIKEYSHTAKKNLFEQLLKSLKITSSQGKCLYYLVKGLSTKKISHILNLPTHSIEAYLNILIKRLGCTDKSTLIAKAIDLGFEYFH